MTKRLKETIKTFWAPIVFCISVVGYAAVLAQDVKQIKETYVTKEILTLTLQNHHRDILLSYDLGIKPIEQKVDRILEEVQKINK